MPMKININPLVHQILVHADDDLLPSQDTVR